MTSACVKCYQTKCSHWSILEKSGSVKHCFCFFNTETISFGATCECGKTANLVIDEDVLIYTCTCNNKLIHTNAHKLTNQFIHDRTKTKYPRNICPTCNSLGKIKQYQYEECASCKSTGILDSGWNVTCTVCIGTGSIRSQTGTVFSCKKQKWHPNFIKCMKCTGSGTVIKNTIYEQDCTDCTI
jgi:hypothetical protein